MVYNDLEVISCWACWNASLYFCAPGLNVHLIPASLAPGVVLLRRLLTQDSECPLSGVAPPVRLTLEAVRSEGWRLQGEWRYAVCVHPLGKLRPPGMPMA